MCVCVCVRESMGVHVFMCVYIRMDVSFSVGIYVLNGYMCLHVCVCVWRGGG